jgi:CRP/FNR family transcriptional regulator, cyclic AMP receptor protein
MRRRETRVDSYLRTLSRLPLFAASSRRELSVIARNSTLVDLPSGHVFRREGPRCDEFVVLVSGSVAVVRGGRPDQFLGAGEWWGAADVLAGTRASSTVIALTDVECLVMSRNEFLGVFDDAPAMRRRLVRSLAQMALRSGRPARADANRCRGVRDQHDFRQEGEGRLNRHAGSGVRGRARAR